MRPLNDYFIFAKIEDVSTAGQVYVPVPDGGELVKVITSLDGTLTTSDATLTVKTAQGTAGTITIAQSGSAAGDIDTLEPTSNNFVNEDENIEIETDGASGGAVSVDVVFIVRR